MMLEIRWNYMKKIVCIIQKISHQFMTKYDYLEGHEVEGSNLKRHQELAV